MKRLLCLALVTVVILAVGAVSKRRFANSPIAASSPTSAGFNQPKPAGNSTDQRRKALDSLRDAPSPLGLQALLLVNGQGPVEVEKIGNSMWGLQAITAFLNDDGERIAVPARIIGTLPPRVTDPAMTPKTDAVFIFDEVGNLTNQLGGTFAADKVNGDAAMLTQLGTSDGLFVFIMRIEPVHGCEVISEVHTLKPNIKRAVRVFHFLNDPAITNSHADVKLTQGAGIGFRGKGKRLELYSEGTGADGRQHSNWIKYDEMTSRFHGASKLTTNDETVFEVDLPRSGAFVPTDRGH